MAQAQNCSLCKWWKDSDRHFGMYGTCTVPVPPIPYFYVYQGKQTPHDGGARCETYQPTVDPNQMDLIEVPREARSIEWSPGINSVNYPTACLPGAPSSLAQYHAGSELLKKEHRGTDMVPTIIYRCRDCGAMWQVPE